MNIQEIQAEIVAIKEHNTRLVFQIENLDYQIHDIKRKIKELEEKK
jgi:peptidoglycan hydrolase CwlO-like protein